jgi:hypothetical protein
MRILRTVLLLATFLVFIPAFAAESAESPLETATSEKVASEEEAASTDEVAGDAESTGRKGKIQVQGASKLAQHG